MNAKLGADAMACNRTLTLAGRQAGKKTDRQAHKQTDRQSETYHRGEDLSLQLEEKEGRLAKKTQNY